MPLLEFTVLGPPISHQTRDRANLQIWKDIIEQAARSKWGQLPPLTGNLKCTIINFHEGERASLDDDNMVKPIRDAMNGLVYIDDRQITYSETIQVSINAPIKIRKGSLELLSAYSVGEEFLYIRLDDAPDFIQLPQ